MYVCLYKEQTTIKLKGVACNTLVRENVEVYNSNGFGSV